MKINSLKTLTSLAVAMAFLLAGSAFGEEVKTKVNIKKPSRFRIVDGKPLELCKDLKKILDEPENKNFGEPYITNAEFIIPKKYKDFREPVWQDVSMEELPEYLSSSLIEKIRNYNEGDKKIAKFLIQKTKIDLNNDGKNDEILRLAKIPDGDWHCYIGDINPSIMSKDHNEDAATLVGNCRLFMYKGKVFKAETGEYDSMFIREPISGVTWGFGYKVACLISFTPSKSKIAGLVLDEEAKNR